MVTTIRKIQQKIELRISSIISNLNEKNRKTLYFIPRVVLFMSIAIYCAGFIRTQTDVAIYAVGIIMLGFLCLFYRMK